MICRRCNHPPIDHRDLYPILESHSGIFNRTLEAIFGKCILCKPCCDCKKFMKDNLEYLEYLYDRKKK
jgi:hypothetical protein